MMRIPHYRKSSRRSRLMFVCCTALLLACLLLLSGCGLTPTRRQYVPALPALPTATPGPSQPVALQDIHMLDEQNGWALTQDKHVLHTSSGPEKWREASPSTGGVQYTPGVYSFLDAQNAWMAMQAGDKFSIFRTYNGGGFWLETPLLDSGNGVVQISFADAQNGWLLFDKGSDARNQAVDIFHTRDGGNSWLLINGVDNKSDDGKGSLPFAGRKTGISFNSPSTGWITGSIVDGKNPLLYMSTDGGFTWLPQTLTLPAGVSGTSTTSAPKFVNATDGVLPVTFGASGGDSRIVVYSTHDGGKTWSAGNATSDISANISFDGDNQGWAAGSGSNADKLYASSDAGRTWSPLTKPDASVSKIVGVDFVSPTNGLVLANAGSNAVRLFQTTDNGKSWTRLSTSASM